MRSRKIARLIAQYQTERTAQVDRSALTSIRGVSPIVAALLIPDNADAATTLAHVCALSRDEIAARISINGRLLRVLARRIFTCLHYVRAIETLASIPEQIIIE